MFGCCSFPCPSRTVALTRTGIVCVCVALVPFGVGMNDAYQESDMADGSIRLHVVTKTFTKFSNGGTFQRVSGWNCFLWFWCSFRVKNMEGCKRKVLHSDWGERDVLQWWPCSSRSWVHHWQHFPFATAWHFFPCLLADNLSFEVHFGHVHILGWCFWSGRNVNIVTSIAKQLCFQRGVPNSWWWFQCMHWTSFKKWWCWLGWMLRLRWTQCSGHVAGMANRQWRTHQIEDSSTCRRWRNGTLTQIDFTVLDRRTLFHNTWSDYVIPIGFDHRCAHCTFHFNTSRAARKQDYKHLKTWEPTLDEDGHPAKNHHETQRRFPTPRAPFSESKQILNSGKRGGKCSRISLAFRASDELQRLRLQRRLAQHCEELRMLSLQIWTLHRQEFRAWKSSKLKALSGNSGKWKTICRLRATEVRQVPEQPQANEVANMLEQIFVGSPYDVMTTALMLWKNDWHKEDVLMAIKRLKANKSADEKVFVAELLHFASDDFLDRLLELFNGLMHAQQVPVEWRKTTFNMLPKHGRAKVPADYRPIASVRLLYCLYDSRSCRTFLGSCSTWRTTCISIRTPHWWTFGDNKFGNWQILEREHANLDYQLGFITSLWLCALAVTLASFIPTRNQWPYD